jgi:hypothetical protein
VRIWLTRDGGADFGAQWIMADPYRDGVLEVSAFAKERRIKVPDSLTVLYWATVTNVGSFDALFSIQGGGLV